MTFKLKSAKKKTTTRQQQQQQKQEKDEKTWYPRIEYLETICWFDQDDDR